MSSPQTGGSPTPADGPQRSGLTGDPSAQPRLRTTLAVTAHSPHPQPSRRPCRSAEVCQAGEPDPVAFGLRDIFHENELKLEGRRRRASFMLSGSSS